MLELKGLDQKVIARYQNLYKENIKVVVVNNIPGRAVKNIRLSLRQGDLPSMHFFSYVIDPLLTYLENRLRGILIASLPVSGPLQQGSPALEERYKVIGYADDVKPAITGMDEFLLIDQAMNLFEKASLVYGPRSVPLALISVSWPGSIRASSSSIWDHLTSSALSWVALSCLFRLPIV